MTEPTWRKMMSHVTLGRHGVLFDAASNSMSVFADATGMQVKVRTGECWIKGHWGEVTAQKTLPITAAHATLGRKDRVILRCDFSNDRIELDVLAGTPASSPAVPALTQDSSKWETSLAIVTIPAADTSIGATQVEDKRGYANRTFARYRLKANQGSIAHGVLTRVRFETPEVESPYDIEKITDTTFQLNRTGWWRLETSVRCDSPGEGVRQVVIGDSTNISTVQYVSVRYAGDGQIVHPAANTSVYLTAGKQVSVGVYQNRGSSMGISETLGMTWFAMTWEGP